MIEDVDMEAIFLKYNNAAIERARMASRRVIRVENHLLLPETPMDDESLCTAHSIRKAGPYEQSGLMAALFVQFAVYCFSIQSCAGSFLNIQVRSGPAMVFR